MALSRQKPKNTRIQAENRQRILDAALDAFAGFGFHGATLDKIAQQASMSKPNLLYYFPTKRDLYSAVLEHTLEEWLEPLAKLDEAGDPLSEIEAYLDRKLQLAQNSPLASRLFAIEIIQGAPHIAAILEGDLKDLVDQKCALIQRWMDEGRLNRIDPHHLIFTIWATTQHFADFDTQVRAVTGKGIDDVDMFERTRASLSTLMLEGLRPRETKR